MSSRTGRAFIDKRPVESCDNLGMPKFTDADIQAAIACGGVFAITIDTEVFDANRRNFQNSVLRRLDQFKARRVRVLVTDVVANEMKAHFRHAAEETQRALKNALRAHAHLWRREEIERESTVLLIDSDAEAYAETEFEAFLENINGEIVKASGTPNAVARILHLYFSKEPPFEAVEKRKSEFPDAFALLSLEALAAEHGKLLMCVSQDRGWAAFSAKSDHLICVEKLEDALAFFNEADQHLANEIVQRWRKDEGGGFMEVVESAFEYRLDDLDFLIKGHADFEFEAEPLSGVLQDVLPESLEKPTVVGVDPDTVTFSVRVQARVGFEACVSFYAYGGDNKEYVGLGSEKAYVEKMLPFDLTITANRSLEHCITFREVEVAKGWFEVDFGYIEAFPNEDPTHEKY